jgi:DNA adenine methylase
MRYISPLRYPGGKAKMAPFFSRLIQAQEQRATTYAEPFAGGAGAALALLTDGVVDTIELNDKNPGIYEFWRNVFTRNARMARLVERTKPTVSQWHRHRETYLAAGPNSDPFELGFATFFLNRCNRSGILSARPIGGLEQTGRWLIDARFNGPALADRIRHLGSLSARVGLSNLDALEFMQLLEPRGAGVFAYVDPPYVGQGEELYMQAFDGPAHAALSTVLARTSLQWALTYDDHEDVKSLYADQLMATFGIAHTAQTQHVGTELLVFSEHLRVPDLQVLPNREGALLPRPALQHA